MFGREIKTRLGLIKGMNKNINNENKMELTIASRHFKLGDRVQVRNYTIRYSTIWCFGKIEKREGSVYYLIRMDNGELWKRHIDQIRSSKFGREN